MLANDTLRKSWFPIADESEVPRRHVHHAMALGRDLAVWRADDGNVNVWENRCLHRGVRLSIGINLGNELRCQYHGWRYANGTANCTYIPAHPANAPARTIQNRTYEARRHYGLVWSSFDPDGNPPIIRDLENGQGLVLRAIPVNAQASTVIAGLNSYSFLPISALKKKLTDKPEMEVTEVDAFTVRATAQIGNESSSVILFVQPVAHDKSIIRGVLVDGATTDIRMPVLRHHSEQLSAFRFAIEVLPAEERIGPQPLAPEAFVSIPARPVVGSSTVPRDSALRVRVAKKWMTATEIAAFRFESIGAELPEHEAGAHIDVHTPNGLVRQYSLTNGPDEKGVYVIGVKREPDSKGGSVSMHDALREGDILAISAPHNNFHLARESEHSILIAGGIGVTPLLAMAKTLRQSGKLFTLHYFARTKDYIAFVDHLETLGTSVEYHLGLDPTATQAMLETILAAPKEKFHVYVCGPGPMLEATRTTAERLGWPEKSIHFEYFKNDRPLDDSSTFEVALARSAVTFKVPAGKTIVEVLRDNGIDVPTSCEQGACGTCLTTVIDGEPDHQDVFLTKAEKASGNCMMTCVSRAKSPRLVLDL